MNDKVKNIIERAVKTFIETAISYLAALFIGGDVFAAEHDQKFWMGVLISAGAAGLSAAWNGVIQPLLKPDITPGA